MQSKLPGVFESMNPADRIVVRAPLEQLWTDNGDLPAIRGRALDRDAVRELLRRGPVRFVVADVGHRLRWIAPADRFELWKRDALPHLAEADEIHLDEDFPDDTAYVASEWLVAGDEVPIILLEVHH